MTSQNPIELEIEQNLNDYLSEEEKLEKDRSELVFESTKRRKY